MEQEGGMNKEQLDKINELVEKLKSIEETLRFGDEAASSAIADYTVIKIWQVKRAALVSCQKEIEAKLKELGYEE